MTFSVIIPTHERRDILLGCLEHLARQTVNAALFEVIVVADRCTDGTAHAATHFFSSGKLSGTVVRSEGPGAAAARNRGLREARGRIILFLDDDIYAAPDLLERHADFHRQNPCEEFALLGFVTWHPDVRPTPFMQWMEQGGPQFAFYRLTDGQEAPWPFFYTCNVSLKRQLLAKTSGFDEDFKQYGFEDPELGFRLHQVGMQLFYWRSAWAHHFQRFTLQSAARRNYNALVSRAVFNSKPAAAALQAEGSRWKTWTDAASMALLLPVELPFFLPLANSRIRLPRFVYRHLFRCYTAGLLLKNVLIGNRRWFLISRPPQ